MKLFNPSTSYFIEKATRALQERERSRAPFYVQEPDTVLYFYLLPPWNERGALYRTVWTHWQIPSASSVTCWKSYTSMGEQCPVCTALNAVQVEAGTKVDRMRPNCKGMLNTLIIGTRSLNARGDPVDPFLPFTEENPKAARVLQLSKSVIERLMSAQVGPLGFICMPSNAVLCMLKKKGTGIDTRYELTFAGSQDAGGNFVPTRTKMFATDAEAAACLGADGHSGLPDLDKIVPLPDEKAVNFANKIATNIRIQFGPPDIAILDRRPPVPPWLNSAMIDAGLPQRSDQGIPQHPSLVDRIPSLSPSNGRSADAARPRLQGPLSRPPSPPPERLLTVQAGQSGRNGFAVPPPAATKANGGVSLNMEVVKAKLKETGEVEAILSTVFIDESVPTPMPSDVIAGESGGHLDAAHSQLLRALVERGSMSREEYKQLAASFGLLPHGALDTINDASFELRECLVCEGDDPIRVDFEVAKEMLS